MDGSAEQARPLLGGDARLVPACDPTGLLLRDPGIPTRELIQGLGSWLVEDEIRYAGRFHFQRDSRMYLLGRMVTRWVLAAETGLPPAAVAIDRDKHGRPCASSSGMDFNLSHADGLLGWSAYRGGRVGVDVESIANCRAAMDIARDVLTPRELAVLEGTKGEDKARCLTRFWTLKEAYLKGIGMGLGVEPNRIDCRVGRCGPVVAVDAIGQSEKWQCHQWSLDNAFVISVVLEKTATKSRPTVHWHWLDVIADECGLTIKTAPASDLDNLGQSIWLA